MAEIAQEPPARAPLAPLLLDDGRRAATFALFGFAAVALVEFVLSLVLTPGDIRFGAAVRFLALDVTLAGIAFLVAVLGFAALAAGTRAIWALFRPAEARTWPGLFAFGPDRAPATPNGAIPWMWALGAAATGYVALSFLATFRFVVRYKDPASVAASLAAIQLALIVVFGLVAVLLAAGVRRLARTLQPGLRGLNPFGRALPAAGMMLLMAVPLLVYVLHRLPQFRPKVPYREAIAALELACGGVVGMRLLARRGRLWPADRRRRRGAMAAAAGAFLVLALPTLTRFGANQEAKVLALAPSPFTHVIDLVTWASDVDGDGFGSLLGERDCAPWNDRIYPFATEIPDNGVDENCNGRDSQTRGLPSWRSGERMPVPDDYLQDWNVLLITVDTVRYDHTSMAGYARNTTPNLARLADRSVNFEFCNAPSAGTMASVPAIVISKFFHSGIALGPERRPKPPKILPENTTIAEVMKRKGYKTGAIVSHEYFNDWGLEQGFDKFDNEIGAKPNPYGITSQDVTARAQSWLAQQGGGRWFLWVHYIDPHGRYVAHPGETQYGTEELDLYDGELAYTDKHIGRLLEFLAKSPAYQRTIIIVTSDHGDAFNEHGFINHGQALYRELLHVPLIFYVPDIEPRRVHGAVSPLDIFPTVADLAGIDISDLAIEGESLVPQLFYGRDAADRVVFAETNLVEPQRAAITGAYKLILRVKSNVWELYDLRKDPWEKKNVWSSDKQGLEAMRGYLDEWLDRVYYARDAASQAQQVRSQWLLAAKPAPKNPSDAVYGDAIRVLGWELVKPQYKLGDTVQVVVYYESVKPTATSYQLELELFGEPAAAAPGAPATPPPAPVRQAKAPGDGTMPTNRWRPGDYWKETFTVKVPATWRVGAVKARVRLLDEKRAPAAVTGAQAGADGKHVLLGVVPMDLTPPPAPPAPPAPAPGAPGAPKPPIPVPGRVAPIGPTKPPTGR